MFLARRLAGFQNIQLQLSRNRPTNYGTMTTLIVHLMRHTMVTPRIKYTFLNDALRDLRFGSVMWRFGMFFLQDLKVKKGVLFLKELPEEDSAEVVHLYGRSLKPRAANIKQPHHLIPIYQQENYPWGPDPSWSRIQKLLETEPENFLGEWRLDDDWRDPEQFQTELLFVSFTCQLWLSIAETFASSGVLPKPATLEDAMRTWTVPGIESILGSDYCRFLPSTHGLKGKLPASYPHQRSFSAHRVTFFPAPTVEIPKNSIWEPYTQPRGYISDYHKYLQAWDEKTVDQLHSDLDKIFGQLQCLPLSGSLEKKSNSIWAARLGKVNFISNSKFYRIREIGKEVIARSRSGFPQRPQASKNVLQRRLDETLGRLMKPPVRSRKSAKTRQKRKPPVRRKRVQPHFDDDEEEREEEESLTSDREGERKEAPRVPRITRSRAKAARENIEREDSNSNSNSASSSGSSDQGQGRKKVPRVPRMTQSRAKAGGRHIESEDSLTSDEVESSSSG
jgi:hypothetical protein